MANTVYTKEWANVFIDLFEDFLDDKKVIIPNEERDREEPEYADLPTAIWGNDYDFLMGKIEDILENFSKEFIPEIKKDEWRN